MKIVIPIEPRTKKNGMRILHNHKTGKRFISQSNAYMKYETDCKWFMPKLSKPIDELVSLKCVYYKGSNIRVDLNNLLEATTDILVKYGVLEDDNYKVVHDFDGSRVYVDTENPRVEITISYIDLCDSELCMQHPNCKGCKNDFKDTK